MVSNEQKKLTPEEIKKEQEKRILSLINFLSAHKQLLGKEEAELVDVLVEATSGRIVQDVGSTSFLEFIQHVYPG